MGARTSRFAASATAEEVAREFDIIDRTYLVTGGNTGLGLETVRVLASRGARVITGVRRPEVTAAAIDGLGLDEAARQRVEIQALDLGSLDSVLAFSQTLRDRSQVLDGVVLNAGIMAIPRFTETADGFESQWGVTPLGHFALTLLLLPTLLANERPARVVAVSSRAHERAHTFSARMLPPPRERYSEWGNYGFSKLSNILFSKGLNARLQERGVTARSLHPGVIPTELARNNKLAGVFYTVGSVFMKDIPQGASTQVYCLLEDAERAPPGLYYADNDIATPTADARSDANADLLWNRSIEILQQAKPAIADLIAADGIIQFPAPVPAPALTHSQQHPEHSEPTID